MASNKNDFILTDCQAAASTRLYFEILEMSKYMQIIMGARTFALASTPNPYGGTPYGNVCVL